MTTDVKVEPVVKKLTVPRDAGTAFEYFTANIDKWWPKRTHSIGKDETSRIVMEDGVGGRFFEVHADGTEQLWGTILEWDPGKRLKYTWHLSRPAAQATHVELRFDDQSDGTCLVTLTHDNWAALADEAEFIRGEYNNGWVHVFEERFGAFAKTGEAIAD